METLTLLKRAKDVLATATRESISTRELATAISAAGGGDPSTIAQGLARLGKAGCPLVWRKEPFIQLKGPRKGQPATHYHWRYSSLEWSPPSTARPAVVADLPQPFVDEIGRLANVAQEHELRLAAVEKAVANLPRLDDAAVATLQRIADIMRTQGWEI